MELVRWKPTAPLSRVWRVFDDKFPWPEWEAESTALGAFNPRVDMFEKDNQLVVEAEVPGVKKENIDIRVEDHVLTMRGEYHEEKKVKEDDYYRHERQEGSFTRSLMLPSNVATEKVDATYKDGVLRVVFPKIEEAKGKKIAVK